MREQIGNVGEDSSLSSISLAIKNRLVSGKLYSRKKISQLAIERFTLNDMRQESKYQMLELADTVIYPLVKDV